MNLCKHKKTLLKIQQALKTDDNPIKLACSKGHVNYTNTDKLGKKLDLLPQCLDENSKFLRYS